MEGLLDWTDKESRMRNIFRNDVIMGRHLLESKMDFLNNLYKSCKPDANSEEKILLNVIKGETRKLEKLIYSNPTVRAIVRLTQKVKKAMEAYRQDRSAKDDLLSIKVKQVYSGYDKNGNGKAKENSNELNEPAREILDR